MTRRSKIKIHYYNLLGTLNAFRVADILTNSNKTNNYFFLLL